MIARARETFFYDGTVEHGGTERPADHPLVARFAAFYEQVEDAPAPAPVEQVAPRRPGRPAKATGGGERGATNG